MAVLPDRLPLVIGVTGHRDLRDQDVARLELEVAAILARLRRDYLGQGTETPLVVVSALAEGADRLVARVALKAGARLIAPMPLPVDEYRRDFEPGLKPGNIDEFEDLLSQAIAAPVVPFTPGNSLEAVRADPAKRNEQYRAVGLFITRYCDVLIALWDGDTDTSAGGTAEVVAFKQRGIPLEVSGSARASLDASEVGPVIHVETPRMRESSAAAEVAVRPWGRALEAKSLFGRRRHASTGVERETWEMFAAVTALTQQFNRDAAALAASPDGTARAQRSVVQLFDGRGTPDPVDSDSARERASAVAPRWCTLYGIADALAQECQGQFRLDWIYLFSFAFVGLVCFDVFSHFFPRVVPVADLLLAGYFLAFLGAFLVYGAASKAQHQERYLDYRVLAEALRVGVFWKLAGLSGSLAESYPIRQPSELSWVKVSLRGLDLLDTALPPTVRTGLDQSDHALVRGLWVHGQYRYFLRQGPRYEKTAHRWETASGLLFALAPFCFAVILIAVDLGLFGLGGEEWIEGHLRHYIIALMSLLPALAAVVVGFTEKLAYSAQARQYDRMRMLFERGYQMLPATVDDSNASLAQALYAELGSEAMIENAEWVAIYRQRPIRPPQG